MSYRIEVLKERLDVLDKLVEVVLANEAVHPPEVYMLAVRTEPAGGRGMAMAAGPAALVVFGWPVTSGFGRMAENAHRPADVLSD